MLTAYATSLMGLGMPGPLAAVLGNTIDNVTAASTTQAAGTTIGAGGNSVALITTSSTDYAVTLSSNIPVNQGAWLYNINATIYAASVFPPSGGAIDGGTTDAAITLAGNEGVYMLRTGSTTWRSLRNPRNEMIPTSATAVGTAQGGSSPVLLANRAYLLTTAGGATAATISSAVPIGGRLECYTITATTGLLFPPSGCTIDQGSADASVNIAQNKGRIIRRMSATAFNTILSA